MVFPTSISEYVSFTYNSGLGHKKSELFVGRIQLWNKLGEWAVHFTPIKTKYIKDAPFFCCCIFLPYKK